MRALLILTLAAVLCAAACGEGRAPGTAGPPPPTEGRGVGLELVAQGVGFVTDLQVPSGDTERLFVADRGGAVRIVRGGAVLPVPFLALGPLVRAGGEQGLLGLAFPPDHASTGRFYVHHTDADGNTALVRYTVGPDPDRADPASRQVIFTTAQPFGNHNGGSIAFGPDGFLYLALGDGGSGGDPAGHGQDPRTVLGAILRFDVSGSGAAGIPPDNPFADGQAGDPAVWTHGLRNPWRISFDRATGDLWIADVGQSEWEEVNVATAALGGGRGINWGWNITEGPDCFGAASCNRTGLSGPAHAYDHDDGCSITGGHVYRGTAVPALVGRYVFADYCSDWIRSLTWNGTAAVDVREWAGLHPGGQVTTFGQDQAGELYLGTSGGRVYRVVEQPAP